MTTDLSSKNNPNSVSVAWRRPLLAALVALCLTLSSFGGIAPQTAWADTRGSDIIAGYSAEQRSLPASLCPSIDADFAMLVDGQGRVYFSRDAQTQTHIASITKVMTAIVALETAPLNTSIVVSPYAASVGESSAGLRSGDVLTLDAALKALMIPSGNDAAVAIAETLGPMIDPSSTGATAFIKKMNETAQAIGMSNSLFANSHGLDNGSHAADMYSTAEDVATMCAYAMQNDTFREVVAMDTAVIPVTRADGSAAEITLVSTDRLIGVYEGACGIKTGFTELAGASFAGACEREGEYLYAIVLHSTSEDQRFKDAETLYNWVYDNRISYTLAHSDETMDSSLGEVPVVGYASLASWLDRCVPVTFENPDQAITVFAPDGNISQDFEFYNVEGAVQAGQVVGMARFYQHNELLAEEPLVAIEDVPAPGFLEGVGIWWQRVWRHVTGEPLQAQSEVINQTPLIFDKTAASTS